MRTSNPWAIATVMFAMMVVHSPHLEGQDGGKLIIDKRAFDLELQSIEFSTPRLIDGGIAQVHVIAIAPRDIQPQSCSGQLEATDTNLSLPFTSCAARRTGPSRYELVLGREFPAAVVNRAFHLGPLVLSGTMGERYISNYSPAKTLEVISTAVIPDLRNARVSIGFDRAYGQLVPGDRFRLGLSVDSTTPIEAATFFLNVFTRGGRGVDGAVLVVQGDSNSPSDWIRQVQRGREFRTQYLTIFAKIPDDLRRDIIKLEVRYVPAMNQSLQFVELEPKGVELRIEEK